jgi:hypothetical protein
VRRDGRERTTNDRNTTVTNLGISQRVTTSSDQSGAFAAGSDALIPPERFESRIFLIRGEKVMLDADLAELYGVTTGALNQAVKRNRDRFPTDFMFQLSESEVMGLLKSQCVTSKLRSDFKPLIRKEILKSQNVISNDETGKGGRRSNPHAFTEQGVAMLSSVLRSPRAVQVNIGIMRAFVRLRQLIASHADLARKLAGLESKYDEQFKIVFDAIRELMSPVVPRRNRELGFHTGIAALRSAKKRAAKPGRARAVA